MFVKPTIVSGRGLSKKVSWELIGALVMRWRFVGLIHVNAMIALLWQQPSWKTQLNGGKKVAWGWTKSKTRWSEGNTKKGKQEKQREGKKQKVWKGIKWERAKISQIWNEKKVEG